METAVLDVPEAEERERTCEKHGAYTSSMLPNADILRRFTKDEALPWSECQTCVQERNERNERVRAEDEARLREERIAGRLKRAQIPPRYIGKTLNNFQPQSTEQGKALSAVKLYAEHFEDNLAAGRCLALLGTLGTGKTHLGCSLLDSLARAGYSVRYSTTIDVIRQIRECWRRNSDRSEEEVLSEFANLDLLLLDEVGVSFASEAELVQLTDLLDQRYRKLKPTAMISNCDRDGLKKYLGGRVLDRLRENEGVVLVLNGDSCRGKRAE